MTLYPSTSAEIKYHTKTNLSVITYEYDRAEFESIDQFLFNGAEYISNKKICARRIDAIGALSCGDACGPNWYTTFNSRVNQLLSTHNVEYIRLNRDRILLFSCLHGLDIKKMLDSTFQEMLGPTFQLTPFPDLAGWPKDYLVTCSPAGIGKLLSVLKKHITVTNYDPVDLADKFRAMSQLPSET